ncbi:MAG: TlpA disulfide reductase family protein [Actinomycetota bacterium]|nr:TlpA disulfide reductase family protein [Actinomycetota bacterium]
MDGDRRRARKLILAATLFACAFLVLLLGATYVLDPSDDGADGAASGGGFTVRGLDEITEPVDGEPLPDETFELFDGTETSFADYRGTPLVVNMWATTCGPCVREMPALEEASQALEGQVAFIGVNVAEQVEHARPFAEDLGITFDLAADPDGSIIAAIGSAAMPTTVFVDADGRMVDVHLGQLDLDELTERVEAALL